MNRNPPTTSTFVRSEGTSDATRSLIPAAFGGLLLLQIYLVFTKGFNWDEFLHFSQIYDLRDDRLTWDLQTLHARVLAWIPATSHDIFMQMQVARLVMLGFETIAISLVVLLARRVVAWPAALLTGLIYLASLGTFIHGFSIRPDPMATAMLMAALYLLATSKLSPGYILLTGALIGVAGVMTIKSIFYLPCFAGMAWLRLSCENERNATNAVKVIAVPVIAALGFAFILSAHRSGITAPAATVPAVESRTVAFLSGGIFTRWQFTAVALLTSPVLIAALLLIPFVLRKRPRAEQLVAIGLLGPLVVLAFYRNTFPYFFMFLLAPVCVAVAPAVALLKERYGLVAMMPIVITTPIVLLITQPFDLLAQQRAQLNEIHRLFPQPTGYLAYTSFVPDYPRIIPNLISGVGLFHYHEAGVPVIANQINEGKVGFVLADSPAVIAGLNGRTLDGTLLPEDFAALNANFLPYVGDIWLLGKRICASPRVQSIAIVQSGVYNLAGSALQIDDRQIADGQSITLEAGSHTIAYRGNGCIRLWALPQAPRAPGNYPVGPTMDGF